MFTGAEEYYASAIVSQRRPAPSTLERIRLWEDARRRGYRRPSPLRAALGRWMLGVALWADPEAARRVPAARLAPYAR